MRRIRITYDEAKRARTLEERGLDFEDSIRVFEIPHLQLEDDRFDYGETRFIVFGELDGRRLAIVWTPRDDSNRIISMRHVHEEELEDIKRTLDRPGRRANLD